MTTHEFSAIRIDPEGVYDDDSLRLLLDVTSKTLSRARQSGDLAFSRQGRRFFYKGKWILDWLLANPGSRASRGEGAQ